MTELTVGANAPSERRGRQLRDAGRIVHAPALCTGSIAIEQLCTSRPATPKWTQRSTQSTSSDPQRSHDCDLHRRRREARWRQWPDKKCQRKVIRHGRRPDAAASLLHRLSTRGVRTMSEQCRGISAWSQWAFGYRGRRGRRINFPP